MAGSELGRGLPKFQETDREGQIWFPKFVGNPSTRSAPVRVSNTWGTQVAATPTSGGYFDYFLPSDSPFLSQFPGFPIVTPSNRDLFLDAGTANPSNGFSAAQACWTLSTNPFEMYQIPRNRPQEIPYGTQGTQIEPNERFTQIIENAQGVPLVINFPQAVSSANPIGNINPPFITIPANTAVEYTWEIEIPFQSNGFGPLIRSIPLTLASPPAGSVTSLTAGNGVVLTPNPITTAGTVSAPITSTTLTVVQAPNTATTINLPASGSGAGSTVWSNITRNVDGIITAASTGTFTSPYGLAITGPSATGYTAALRQSWMALNILAVPTPALVASGAALNLDDLGLPFTNDIATFSYTQPTDAFTINITGQYLFLANFVVQAAIGDGLSYVFSDSGIPANYLDGPFGGADGPVLAAGEAQTVSTAFVYGITGPRTLQLTNFSLSPTHVVAKGNVIVPNATGISGYLVVVRLS